MLILPDEVGLGTSEHRNKAKSLSRIWNLISESCRNVSVAEIRIGCRNHSYLHCYMKIPKKSNTPSSSLNMPKQEDSNIIQQSYLLLINTPPGCAESTPCHSFCNHLQLYCEGYTCRVCLISQPCAHSVCVSNISHSFS